MACIEVADRGPGIAADDVERLKQPFTRATEARARADGAAGAGLGLAIVDRIARLHGGTFDLVPRDGGGTVARVTLSAWSLLLRVDRRAVRAAPRPRAAMPSPRPVKPRRSVVVALTETRSMSQSRSAATFARMAATNGAIFGACAMTVASTLPMP